MPPRLYTCDSCLPRGISASIVSAIRTVRRLMGRNNFSSNSYENDVYSPTCTSSPSMVFNGKPFNQTRVSYPHAPNVNCIMLFFDPFPFVYCGKGNSRSYQATTLSCQAGVGWSLACAMCSSIEPGQCAVSWYS